MEKIKTKILQTAFSNIIIFNNKLYYYSKDASSFALRISWLKIEPMSQFFLSQKAKAFCDYCYGNKFFMLSFHKQRGKNPSNDFCLLVLSILESLIRLVLSLKSLLNLRLEKQNDCLVEYSF